MPKVSVVIPCYNLGQFLDEAVNSVLNQTFVDFEILVVNDGSTDDATKHLLSEYQKPKTVVYHTENQGLPASRNYGIQRSKGEFIVCLDADDKLHPDFLKRSIGVLNESTERVGFVPIGVQRFGDSDSVFIPSETSPYHVFAENLFICACMFRRSCWEIVGGYNESMRQGYEDWDFWLKLIEKGYRWKTIPDVLFYYRDRKDSMISNSRKQPVKLLRTLHKLHLEFIRDHLLEILSAYDEIVINSHKSSRHFVKQYQRMDARLHQLREENKSLFEKYLALWWFYHVETNASTVALLCDVRHAQWMLSLLRRHGCSLPSVVIDKKGSESICGVPLVPFERIDWNNLKTIVISADVPEVIVDTLNNIMPPESVSILRPFANFPSINWPVNQDGDPLFASGLISMYNSFAFSSSETMACYLLGQSNGVIGQLSTQARTVLQARAVLEPLVSRWERECSNKRVLIFGAGNHSKVILGVVPSLFNFVVGFIDSNIRGEFIGLRCYTPAKIDQHNVDVIVYSSAEHELEMYNSVAHLDVQHVLLYHQQLQPY